jgi:hypothetical protein
VSLGGHVNLTDQVAEETGGVMEKQKRYTAKTKVCRRTLHPVWDEEFRFDVSNDTLLQDEPLIFKVCDSDALSVDESIGLVYVDLNPLLTMTASKDDQDDDQSLSDHGQPAAASAGAAGILDGWFPLYVSTQTSKQFNCVLSVVPNQNTQTTHCNYTYHHIKDTLGGVRGELEISVKLNFIGDVNPFRDSSAGVQLFPFSTLDPAAGYSVVHVFGFVEELVVADDPEFEWTNDNTSSTTTNNLRKSKLSHETRQTLLYLLDAAVRRKMCKTVLDKGGNAVLGYHQNFDVEGDSGIVARTYGTCVLLERKQQQKLPKLSSTRGGIVDSSSNHSHRRRRRHRGGGGGGGETQTDSEHEDDDEDDDDDDDDDDSRAQRRSSVALVPDSIPRGRSAYATLPLGDTHHHTDDDEVQLLTLRDFDPRVRVRIGGLVTARSVKYLGNLASKLSDQETRDSWWTELRDEIRSHAKILCCSHVVGYLEASTIHEDVAILSITGTACTVRGLPDMYLQNQPRLWEDPTSELDHHQHDVLESQDDLMMSSEGRASHKHHHKATSRSERIDRRLRRAAGGRAKSNSDTKLMLTDAGHGKQDFSPKRVRAGRRVIRAREAKPCSYCHVPYHHRLAPFTNMKLVPCLLCGKKWVPEVVLATCEPPSRLPIRGPGVFIQARVCRSRPQEKNGESDALAVSEALPFLEYELARQLMLKLKASIICFRPLP